MSKTDFDDKIKALKPKAGGSETAATMDLLTRYLDHAQTKLRETPLGVDNVVELLEALFADEDVTVDIQKSAYIPKQETMPVQVRLGKSPNHFNVYAVANGKQVTISVDPARPGGNYRDQGRQFFPRRGS